MRKPLPKPSFLEIDRRHMVRIHEVEFPLTTLDTEELKAGCLVPIFEPGVLPLSGEHKVVIKSASEKAGQVFVGVTPGLTGAECLIVRETAGAMDELRAEIDVLRKGMRATLQISEELAAHAAIGQDGRTASHLRNLQAGIKDLRTAFFPDDPPADSSSDSPVDS